MEESEARWFSDAVLDDPSFINQWALDSADQLITPNLWEDLQQCPSSESYVSYPSFNLPLSTTSNSVSGSSMDSIHVERPKKLPKTNSRSSSCTAEPKLTLAPNAPSPSILSFGNPDSPSDDPQLYQNLVTCVIKQKETRNLNSNASKTSFDVTVEQEQGHGQGQNTGTRLLSGNKDHIIAERNRREKLSRRFIALSAIIPGLKKVDKVSVLEAAIKNLVQLQEKVKSFEYQAEKKTVVELAAVVKKPQIFAIGDDTSCDENLERRSTEEKHLEINARLSQNTVFIKIHCENHKGILVKALSEIENLHLFVINTSVIPLAGSILDISIMAQVEKGFSVTVKDLLKNLNLAIRQITSRG